MELCAVVRPQSRQRACRVSRAAERPLYDWPERRAATIVFAAFAALAVGTRVTCQGVRPGMAIGILLDATAVSAPLSLCSGGRTGCCLGPSRPWMRIESPFGTPLGDDVCGIQCGSNFTWDDRTWRSLARRRGLGMRGRRRPCGWKPAVGCRCSPDASARFPRKARAGGRSGCWCARRRLGAAGPIGEG